MCRFRHGGVGLVRERLPHQSCWKTIYFKDSLEVLELLLFECGVTDPVGPVPHTSYTSDSPVVVMGMERNVVVRVGRLVVNTCGQPVVGPGHLDV